MEKTKKKRMKLAISFFGVLYTAFLAWILYMSVFYRIEYNNPVISGMVLSVINLVFMFVLILTGNQKITKIMSIVNFAVFLPTFLLEFGNWILLIPTLIALLVTFFSTKLSATVKTVWTVVIVIIYIVGTLGFYIFTNVFLTNTDNTTLVVGTSPEKTYRYYVVDVQNNSTGRTEVYVEPNNKDKDILTINFLATGYEVKKYNAKNHDMPTVEWREGEKLYINNRRYDIDEWKWKYNFNEPF